VHISLKTVPRFVSEIADIMLQIVESHPLCVSWSSKHPTDSSHMALDRVNDQATKDDR
jgi:hypothetical protein